MRQTILAIESSCDETAAAVVTGEFATAGVPIPSHVTIHTNVVESQIAVHLPFGGVVPEVAARDHLAKIDDVVARALAGAPKPDVIAVTMGPGLIGALMVGVLYARGLAVSTGLPLIGINHVDAHLAPALLTSEYTPDKPLQVPRHRFPALALTVSGGHCHLSILASHQERTILGRTADDACGEAFDKVAKLLGLPYPGGPQIEGLAREAISSRFKFPATIADRTNRYGFSYSGIKTSVLHALKKELPQQKGKLDARLLSHETKAQVARAFQDAALGQLHERLGNALADADEPIQSIFVAGGVAANHAFRERMATFGLPLFFAPLRLCSDNAVMIGLHALLHGPISREMLFRNGRDGFSMQPFTRYTEDELERRR